jgi:hypothetical protein
MVDEPGAESQAGPVSAADAANAQIEGGSDTDVPMQGNFTLRIVDAKSGIKEISIKALASKPVSDEETLFRSDIESTLTTLNGIFPEAAQDERQRATLNRYIEKLYWVAEAGLEVPGEPRLGALALRSFQNDVLLREGARLKNGYMISLGIWAASFATAGLVIYLTLNVLQWFNWQVSVFRPFSVLWIGAIVGCWLSFGIRNVHVTYSDLGRPESDLLQPNVRLIFTGLLSLVLGLIFSTQMVEVDIGNFKSSELPKSDEVALLIGLFCGIAEQTLSSTIGSRASQFMGQISK